MTPCPCLLLGETISQGKEGSEAQKSIHVKMSRTTFPFLWNWPSLTFEGTAWKKGAILFWRPSKSQIVNFIFVDTRPPKWFPGLLGGSKAYWTVNTLVGGVNAQPRKHIHFKFSTSHNVPRTNFCHFPPCLLWHHSRHSHQILVLLGDWCP